MRRAVAQYPVQLVVLLGLYWGTGTLGLTFGVVGGVATTVWPPTGIALAALLVLGPRVWPAITLAAFLLALQTGVPLLAASGIAMGNTLEALVGAQLLARAGFRTSLDRIRDVMALVVLAALLSTTVSAAVATASLWLGGVPVPHGYGYTWWVWWVGDLMGDLVVAPLLLVWTATLTAWRKRPVIGKDRWRLVEAAMLAVVLTAVTMVAMGCMLRTYPVAVLHHSYIILPFLVWASLRFRQRGAVTATFLVSVIAVGCTSTGRGPFALASRGESLLSLQMFMAVVAVTVLVLAAAISERGKAVQIRDEFLSIASHELKTPITTLRLRMERLLRNIRRTPDVPPDNLTAWIATSLAQVDRLVAQIDQLLDVSRIEAGRLQLRLDRFDLADVVRDVIDRFRDQAAASGCTIEPRLAPAVGEWDRARLDQVVTNLLTNAMKYGPGQPVGVSVRAEGGRACLVVEDHGEGINENDQVRIFERFERVSASQSAGGLGLGLYIVRQIVEAHGGTIGVESSRGAGARFSVELPAGSCRRPSLGALHGK